MFRLLNTNAISAPRKQTQKKAVVSVFCREEEMPNVSACRATRTKINPMDSADAIARRRRLITVALANLPARHGRQPPSRWPRRAIPTRLHGQDAPGVYPTSPWE